MGGWVISYHPNGAIRTYIIYSSGKVTFIENGEEWLGSLNAVKANATSSFMLHINRAPDYTSESQPRPSILVRLTRTAAHSRQNR